MLYVDLDGFKPVNDAHGHIVGDDVLVEVAERLRSSIRPVDVVARLGGDEFAVLLRSCTTDEADAIAARILDELREPIETRGKSMIVRASIGIAAGGAASQLIDEADRALLRAKGEGGDRAVWAT